MPKICKIETNFGFHDVGARPVLVDFQNGKVQGGADKEMVSAIFRHEKQNNLLVGVSTGNMVYTGLIDNDSDLYNNFLVVHDQNSKKVKLIQVDYAVVQPLLEKKQLVEVSPSKGEKSIYQLNKEFGSKRTKRQTEQKERLKMNIDSVKEQLEKTVTDIDIKESDLNFSQSSENESLYRPNINREASTKDQVYNLHELVPASVLQSLSEKSAEILGEGDLAGLGLYSCILKHVQNLQTSSISDRSKIEKCNIFLYINSLIKFTVTPLKNLTKKFLVCEWSSLVDHHIKDNFAVHVRNTLQRPLAMKDKALCYLLILLLIAADYEVEVEELSKDAKIGLKKIQEYSRVLSLTPANRGKSVMLKLPLPAPVLPSAKRKRR